jgi:hypothetical protein
LFEAISKGPPFSEKIAGASNYAETLAAAVRVPAQPSGEDGNLNCNPFFEKAYSQIEDVDGIEPN